MKTCKTCKWWEKIPSSENIPPFHMCANQKAFSRGWECSPHNTCKDHEPDSAPIVDGSAVQIDEEG